MVVIGAHCLPLGGGIVQARAGERELTLFSTGPYACVGKRLAMVEMRRVTAEIVSRYDIAVAPGQSKEQFLDGVQDTFTTVAAPLHLIFTKRAESEDGKGRL